MKLNMDTIFNLFNAFEMLLKQKIQLELQHNMMYQAFLKFNLEFISQSLSFMTLISFLLIRYDSMHLVIFMFKNAIRKLLF